MSGGAGGGTDIDATVPRLVFDVSTLARSRGQAVGIVRVVRELARWARQNRDDVLFVIFDKEQGGFREVAAGRIDGILDGNELVDTSSQPSRGSTVATTGFSRFGRLRRMDSQSAAAYHRGAGEAAPERGYQRGDDRSLDVVSADPEDTRGACRSRRAQTNAAAVRHGSRRACCGRCKAAARLPRLGLARRNRPARAAKEIRARLQAGLCQLRSHPAALSAVLLGTHGGGLSPALSSHRPTFRRGHRHREASCSRHRPLLRG